MPETLTCPNCSAPLTYDGKSATITCDYCQTPVIVPQEMRGKSSDTKPASPPADLLRKWSEIQELALSGNKIEAIRRMRDTFEIGLKDAKDAIEAIEQGQTMEMSSFKVISSHRPATVMDAEDSERIRLLLQEGNKIEAIKMYRELMDVGLKEASEAIDAMEMGFKALDWVDGQEFPSPIISTTTSSTIDRSTTKKVTTGTKAVSAGAGCMGSGIVLFIILVTVIPILIGMASRGGPLNEPWMRVNPFGHARLLASFGGEGTGIGLFQDPRYVATDNQGHLFVGEYDDGRIQIFDMKGKFLSQWTPVNEEDYDFYLRGMAVDRNGMMYMAAQGELYVYNAMTGEKLGKFPPPGDDSYSFDEVFIGPDGMVYATESWHEDNILRYDRNRQITLLIPNAIGSVTDESESSIRLGVDGLGRIFALGTSSESVFVFAPNGKYVTRFGSEGDAKDQFTSTYAIAVDNQSRIYVSDFGGLVVFSSDGRYQYRISMPGYVYGMSFTDENQLITVDTNNKVMVWEIK